MEIYYSVVGAGGSCRSKITLRCSGCCWAGPPTWSPCSEARESGSRRTTTHSGASRHPPLEMLSHDKVRPRREEKQMQASNGCDRQYCISRKNDANLLANGLVHTARSTLASISRARCGGHKALNFRMIDEIYFIFCLPTLTF